MFVSGAVSTLKSESGQFLNRVSSITLTLPGTIVTRNTVQGYFDTKREADRREEEPKPEVHGSNQLSSHNHVCVPIHNPNNSHLL
jgi:hypothetical protein